MVSCSLPTARSPRRRSRSPASTLSSARTCKRRSGSRARTPRPGTAPSRSGRSRRSDRSEQPGREPRMRVGISGTHGTGKTTLAQALCAHLPGHVAADEPYYLLEAEGYEFGYPPSPEDYRALLVRSVRCLSSPPLRSRVVFDRTPLDYLAYMAAIGADLPGEAIAAALRPAFASLDLLV